ncbi:MAG: hypothetical protein WBI07_18820 [Mobilitalea sp.]
MKIMKSILPHIMVILAGIFITFLVLDEYNPTMNFIDNPVTLKVLWIFCVLTIINSVMIISSNRRINSGKEEK